MLTFDKLWDNIGAEMYWREPALDQIRCFQELCTRIAVLYDVDYEREFGLVDTHRSKSIDLPVVLFTNGEARVTVLDNFYETDLHYDGPPVRLSEEELRLPAMTWDEYLAEITRCEGYSWRGWTQAEIEDPRISRIEVTRQDGGKYWNEQSFGAKERWLKRFENADWYSHDWSKASIIGDFEAAKAGTAKLYRQDHPFTGERNVYRANRKFSIAYPTRSYREPWFEELVKKLLGPPPLDPRTPGEPLGA